MNLNNPENFATQFIGEYFQSDFGSLSKRDIEILVFHLLLKDGRYDLPKDMFKACRELKLTETKVRNLYQSAQLKYALYDEDEAKARFIELVGEGLIERKGDKLVFIVRDPLLRQYFEEWVAEQGGFTDSSFNKNLVTVHRQTLEAILGFLAIGDIEQIQNHFVGETDLFAQATDRPGLIRLFTEEFFKSAGKEAGALSVKALGMGLKILLLG
jgi:hypothetical protein